jgi:hypothetical protein
MSERHPDFSQLEADFGVVLPGRVGYYGNGDRVRAGMWKRSFAVAMDEMAPLLASDALPTAITAPNSGFPAWLTTTIDPEVVRVALAPLAGARIYGEQKRGTWTSEMLMFPMLEMTGEVSSYGDFNNNGRAGVNTQWEPRQSYHFQTIIEYGDREIELAGEAKLQLVAELQTSAANALNRYSDFTYHLGVAGLMNYGALNDPQLTAALTPATKAAGGTRWVTAGGALNATANEIFADIQALYFLAVTQGNGTIERDAPMTLALSPVIETALTSTNIYNVNVADLLQKNFPNLKIITDVRYATTGGQLAQLIVDTVDGIKTLFGAFTEKMREHNLVPDLSSKKQKTTSGTWGTIVRRPYAVGQMLGL